MRRWPWRGGRSSRMHVSKVPVNAARLLFPSEFKHIPFIITVSSIPSFRLNSSIFRAFLLFQAFRSSLLFQASVEVPVLTVSSIPSATAVGSQSHVGRGVLFWRFQVFRRSPPHTEHRSAVQAEVHPQLISQVACRRVPGDDHTEESDTHTARQHMCQAPESLLFSPARGC